MIGRQTVYIQFLVNRTDTTYSSSESYWYKLVLDTAFQDHIYQLVRRSLAALSVPDHYASLQCTKFQLHNKQ